MSKIIPVWFGPNETGWAGVKNGKVTLNNIPLEPDVNLDDEVELSEVDGVQTILRVVNRCWPMKSRLTYEPNTGKAWLTVSNAIRDSGLGWTEGYVNGQAGVAHVPGLTQEALDKMLEPYPVTAKLRDTIEAPFRGRREAATGGE